MTKAESPRSVFIFLAAFAALAVFMGLWEVGWRFAALPAWFYAYALGVAVVARWGLHLRVLDGPQRALSLWGEKKRAQGNKVAQATKDWL